MTSKPFLNLFNKDWLTDPKLRSCRPASRSLWIDLLTFSCLEEPIGFVSVSGKPMSANDIATSIAGWTAEAVVQGLDDLKSHSVFSVDRRGLMYSRRIVRDEKLAQISRKNGKKGGNPSLSKTTTIPNRDNPRLAGARSRAGIGSGNGNGKDKEGLEKTSQKVALPGDELDRWYRAYPLKQARGQAERAFATARKIASLEELIDGVDRYKAAKPPDRHWKYPATWLNGKCWLDEPELFPNGATARSPPAHFGSPPEKTVSDEIDDYIAELKAKEKSANG